MPTFNITAPDGTKYRVEAPEGASEQDALAKVQAQHTPQTANARVAEDFAALPKPAGQRIAESLQAGDLATGNPLSPPLTDQKTYPPLGPVPPGKAALMGGGAAAAGLALPFVGPAAVRTGKVVFGGHDANAAQWVARLIAGGGGEETIKAAIKHLTAALYEK